MMVRPDRPHPDWVTELETISGWLEPEEALLLAKLASEVQNGRVVELGSYQGKSTVALARSISPGSRVIAVDTFRGSPEHQPGAAYFDAATLDAEGAVDTLPILLANLRRFGLEARVEIWRADSAAAATRMRKPVGLLFVDADHLYARICDDLAAWLPLLSPGGIVVLHDVGEWPGPTRAAADLLDRGFCRVAQAGTALALRAPS